MFSRKKSETEDRKMSDSSDDLGIPMKPARTPAQSGNVAPLPRTPAPVPPRVPDPPRPMPEAARVPDPTPRPAPPPPAMPAVSSAPRLSDSDVRKLIVGREISLSGEINSCDKLIVEGSVEANLQNCRDVDIAESGLFKGSATVEDIEVRGRFEGNLIARKRLLVRSTGHVAGSIRYGEIEVERGGQISGDIQAAQPNEQFDIHGSRAAY